MISPEEFQKEQGKQTRKLTNYRINEETASFIEELKGKHSFESTGKALEYIVASFKNAYEAERVVSIKERGETMTTKPEQPALNPTEERQLRQTTKHRNELWQENAELIKIVEGWEQIIEPQRAATETALRELFNKPDFELSIEDYLLMATDYTSADPAEGTYAILSAQGIAVTEGSQLEKLIEDMRFPRVDIVKTIYNKYHGTEQRKPEPATELAE